MNLRRPSTGTVLGATALVVALAGTGTAADAAKLISGNTIKPNTITTKQIKDGTLTVADLAPGTLATGSTGPAGPAGPKGATGPAGANGVSGFQTVQATSPSVASGAVATAMASCPTGKKVLGATAWWSTVDAAVQIYPHFATSETTYVAKDKNPGTGSDAITLQINCAAVAP
ncbi:collagen-like protein [Nocardioides sp.]|uniref:collagen-like triple helix repeat-containing protein n=1 Tax=Nocardioides sp. TaxID=35761 RepID=UPI0039E69408